MSITKTITMTMIKIMIDKKKMMMTMMMMMMMITIIALQNVETMEQSLPHNLSFSWCYLCPRRIIANLTAINHRRTITQELARGKLKPHLCHCKCSEKIWYLLPFQGQLSNKMQLECNFTLSNLIKKSNPASSGVVSIFIC